jgi:hypothetical protein
MTDRASSRSQAFLARFNEGLLAPGDRFSGEITLSTWNATQELCADLEFEYLDLSNCQEFTRLPAGLRAYELRLAGTSLRTLPSDIRVIARIDLTRCRELTELPEGLTVGALGLAQCSSLLALPENLDVWFLDLSGCWAFNGWPERAKIRGGRLQLRGCSALTSLPDYLGQLASLDVRDCPNLSTLPDNLHISGWIDIAHSGLAQLTTIPDSLRGVEVRWQSVRIDERIWLDPGSITLDEILHEQNAELRRVKIDRFGQSRFVEEAQPEVLDSDQDPGGRRRLLRIELKDDEPLVTLDCRCPSTNRQYYLRVPPSTKSCHQAAAWIAGFDNPDDYQPLIET